MTTTEDPEMSHLPLVVEAYRLDRYDNLYAQPAFENQAVVEAYRLDRYDNSFYSRHGRFCAL